MLECPNQRVGWGRPLGFLPAVSSRRRSFEHSGREEARRREMKQFLTSSSQSSVSGARTAVDSHGAHVQESSFRVNREREEITGAISRSRIAVQARGSEPHHSTLTHNNSMGLKCLLATVGIVFTLSISSVFAEPATLSFTDCFSGDPAYQVQVSNVYGQKLDDRYLNFTIIGNSPIQIVSASNNTEEPVASTCHLIHSFSLQCVRVRCADLVDCLRSDPFHDHRPAHVQRMGQRILLLRHPPTPVPASHSRCERRQRLLPANARTLRVLDRLQVSGGLPARNIQHPSARPRP
jgi:hypothetical protein